jgi:hypothetical protein
MQYLGHVISKRGILPDPGKTLKLQEFPIPTDVTRVRQSLGLVAYYKQFVPGFAHIATHCQPLACPD